MVVVAGGHETGVFMFTDIVGSTRLWSHFTDEMERDLAVHDDVVQTAIVEGYGSRFAAGGDSFCAVFDSVDTAVGTAVTIQQRLSDTEWLVPGGVNVRLGLHAGEAQRRDQNWFGPPLNEAARIMSVAHGGQILVSDGVRAELSEDLTLVDLGEHRLRDVADPLHLWQVCAPELETDFPPIQSMTDFVTTLPTRRTSLVGRKDVIAHVRGLLADHRLVTVVGPGGAGKTRVAIEAAGRELAQHPGGVYFVDLTTANGDDEVVPTFLSGVDVTTPPGDDLEQFLVQHLLDRDALIVVDRVADVLDALLDGTQQVRFLTTSREALDLDGERRVVLEPLRSDGPTSPAVRLFVERSLEAGEDATFDDDALRVVETITQRLDGLPLAIELAAARTRTFGPSHILTLLDNRFRLLAGSERRAVERHRTLSAAIDWSYDLLDEAEQRALRMLSMCAGSFTAATTGRLLGLDAYDGAEMLDSLCNKSLVTPLHLGTSQHGFRLQESIREYGRATPLYDDEREATRRALETALAPPVDVVADWHSLLNDHLTSMQETLVVEKTTRREAAVAAYHAGRLDSAAVIFATCTFRDEPGTLDSLLPIVTRLYQRRAELDDSSWKAAAFAKVGVERMSRRYAECFATADETVRWLRPDDPARPWFQVWMCAFVSAVAPEDGLRMIEQSLPSAFRHARPPHDMVITEALSTKSTDLAVLRRLDEASEAAAEARAWAVPGTGVADQALALQMWLAYLTDTPTGADLRAAVAAQNAALGLAELCGPPAVLCSGSDIAERARGLSDLSRRRTRVDLATPLLLAFAWLWIEAGDHDRANELARAAELYDASTEVGLIYLVARLEGWGDDDWNGRRDATIAWYLDPAHVDLSDRGPAELTAELTRWT